MISKHPISKEFPEYLEQIKQLHLNHAEFQVLLQTYSELDAKIYAIERNELVASDDDLTHYRKDRVFLKDEIYSFLKNN